MNEADQLQRHQDQNNSPDSQVFLQTTDSVDSALLPLSTPSAILSPFFRPCSRFHQF